jgi:putative ABC transport system substrate-binding protein
LSEAARILDISVQEPVHVGSVDELPGAFETMKQRRTDAFIVASGSFLLPARARVAELATQARLPGIAAFKQFPEAGLLMSYGPDIVEINRRAGGYVDRILKGAKPGDLPIELPSKFDLAINLRTAQALGLAVDQSLRLRATELYPPGRGARPRRRQRSAQHVAPDVLRPREGVFAFESGRPR